MTRNEIFTQIASDHLHVSTLQTRNSDELDFHDCSVWAIKAALEAAYDAGLRQRRQMRHVKKHPADGTGYIGLIKASYTDLIDVFGKPSEGDGFKTEAAWLIMLPRKEVATIYNYKSSRSYSPDFPRVEEITEWHVGGHRGTALDALLKKLGAKATLLDREGNRK